MLTNAGNVQDLQIFLSRASGTVPMLGGQLPDIIAMGPTRQASVAPTPTGNSYATLSDGFLDYVAVANSEAVENIQLPFSPESLTTFLRKLASDEVSLRECIDFGAQLFDAVFHRSIRDQLRSLASRSSALRLTIATSTPELLILPWELLCDTQFGVLPRFLCQRREIHLNRSLRLFNRAEFELVPLCPDTLRILLVTASPSTLPPINNQKEEDMLRFVMEEAPALQRIDLHVIHDATVNEVRKQLEYIKPHIVHVSCHGLFDRREGLGHVVFCAEEDRSQPDLVNAFRFAALLREPNSVRLVFLSTCHGAAQDPISTFSGVAECLHAIGISAVAALQFKLLDRTGHAIALNFYRHLLRERLSVEESVTRIRQYLFLNNHTVSECFGLALFQDNCSLSWRDGDGSPDTSEISKRSDAEFVSSFESALKQKTFEKLSTELDRIMARFADLASLTTADLALTLNVFGDIDTGLAVLREIRRVGIPLAPFLKMAKLALVLCQSTHEQEQIVTSILLLAPPDPGAYAQDQATAISEKLETGFFWGEIKRVVGEAIKVNGIDRAFVALASESSPEVSYEHIRNLKAFDDTVDGGTSVMGHPQWKRVFVATIPHGCAFILPERSRIKVVVGGAQIAEYRHGKWAFASLAGLQEKLPALASDSGISLELLSDMMQKALVASDLGSGRTFVLKQKSGAEPRLVPGYKNIETEGASELRSRPVTDFDPVDYLKMVEGDGAVIISFEGRTVAINAKLAPAPETQVSEIVSAGTRHLSAQKITKESSTVAIVVSDDGPVTIFFRGRPVFRKPT